MHNDLYKKPAEDEGVDGWWMEDEWTSDNV